METFLMIKLYSCSGAQKEAKRSWCQVSCSGAGPGVPKSDFQTMELVYFLKTR